MCLFMGTSATLLQDSGCAKFKADMHQVYKGLSKGDKRAQRTDTTAGVTSFLVLRCSKKT